MSKLKSHYTMVPDRIIQLKLTHSALKVMLYLLTWQHKEEIYVGHERISSECHIDVSSVKRALKYLEKEGFIKIASGKKDRRTNNYTIDFAAIDEKCVLSYEENELREIEFKKKVVQQEGKREKELRLKIRNNISENRVVCDTQ